jgi:antitoxin PrlF
MSLRKEPAVMEKAITKLSSKYQTTIPEPVRNALKLGKGDFVLFEVTKDEVRIKRARPVDVAYLSALTGTLEEWAGEADEKAYRDL